MHRYHMSKYWSLFSQIYVTDIKQDYIICDFCTLFNFALYLKLYKVGLYILVVFFFRVTDELSDFFLIYMRTLNF
jgi:hypothetical protein